MIDTTLKHLQRLAEHDQNNFVLYFIENSESIWNWTKSFDGVKTQMNLFNIRDQIDTIRFSLVFSDLITLYALGNGEKKITTPKQDVPQSIMKTLTIPEDILTKYNLQKSASDFIPGYISCGFNQLRDFAINLRKQIASKRIVLCPDRIVLTLTNEKAPDGGRIWQVLQIDPSSPAYQWIVSEKTSLTESIPLIDNIPEIKHQKELQTIMVPYLSGITLSDLEKVIQDNYDYVSSFRSHIKDLIRNHSSAKTLNEINQDLIRPDIEKINRKFKQVSNMHKLRVSGVVSVTSVISLMALSALGIDAAIWGFLGTGGLGLIGSESKHQEDLSSLEDNSMFLLWKIKQLKK
ncbi:MAG TPA: hypothetical protein VJ963_15170 [Bacteroidales bacterium]|nr:hypothetical protein [Bacteroidales bacterium]